MAETLQTLSTLSFAVAGVCFVLAAFLWFVFKIPSVVGDLSGRTARKSIAKMRAANEKTGVKSYKESKTNIERGKITGSIPNSDELDSKNEISANVQPETGLLAENKAEDPTTESTGILDEETGELNCETTGLLVAENETTTLDIQDQNQVVRTGGKKIAMLEEIMLIHTNEVI